MAVFDFIIEGWHYPIAATPRSTICHRSTTKGIIQQRLVPQPNQHRLLNRGRSTASRAWSLRDDRRQELLVLERAT
jgi:hypothetical protein